jgi:hypothetical protein
VLGIVNGTLRELLYKDSVGDLPAHYISTATLIVLLALYIWMLEQRWPLPSSRDAWRVGLTWVALTASFDFGFGHFVDHKSWAELAKDYNVMAGRVWVLILLWIAVAPEVMRQRHASGDFSLAHRAGLRGTGLTSSHRERSR